MISAAKKIQNDHNALKQIFIIIIISIPYFIIIDDDSPASTNDLDLLSDTRRRKDDAGKQQKGLSRAMMDCWQEDGRGHGLSDDLCITS
ncbi:hypothetical protein CEXT_27501 [Caerostris extrusa]|uniref:Uncharacterized protein n=1 Tax=Caerostris extrusa TaxID=172846 RepID=A0AAV4SZU8_CAEEX|nr:hypothetical protein CEXT_27501 [Caerostris extrusa]